MKAFGFAVTTLSLLPLGAIAAETTNGCDLAVVKYRGELQSVLSRRAVEVVNKAARSGRANDARLEQLVAPSAEFSLGSGDVGMPLGAGVRGARALAVTMKADAFRYINWNYMPTPAEAPCGLQKVEVEFTATPGRILFPVTFTFMNGQVIAAVGWSRTFEVGRVEPTGK